MTSDAFPTSEDIMDYMESTGLADYIKGQKMYKNRSKMALKMCLKWDKNEPMTDLKLN